jgi:hypothetical protein
MRMVLDPEHARSLGAIHDDVGNYRLPASRNSLGNLCETSFSEDILCPWVRINGPENSPAIESTNTYFDLEIGKAERSRGTSPRRQPATRGQRRGKERRHEHRRN